MNIVPPKPLPPSPPRPRLQLSAVVKGKRKSPRRILLYGLEGIGKSTFGADAPKPIFLGAEDGTDHLDVARLPTSTWEQLLEGLALLRREKHDYGTAVVDTIDWIEPLLWAFVCQRDGEKSIESYGYGKGYTAALDEWRVLLRELEALRREKGMEIILLGHSIIKAFKNPSGDDFDRYQLKIHDKAAGLLKEWSDFVLFAAFETYAKGEKTKDGKLKGKAKGVSTGARLIYTVRTAAYDAKNRAGLPEELPLSYAEFDAACAAGQPASTEDLVAAVKEKAAQLGGDVEKQVLASLQKAGTDPQKLVQLNTWCNAKLAAESGKEN